MSEQSGNDGAIDWRIVLRGSLLGLFVIVPVTILRVIVDRETGSSETSGWVYPLFVLLLAGYLAAGWIAGRARATTPLTHGSLAGAGTLLCWIPIRIVIWAVHDNGRGLFRGTHAALAPGQLFGNLVIAAGIGMLGGWLGARYRRTRT